MFCWHDNFCAAFAFIFFFYPTPHFSGHSLFISYTSFLRYNDYILFWEGGWAKKKFLWLYFLSYPASDHHCFGINFRSWLLWTWNFCFHLNWIVNPRQGTVTPKSSNFVMDYWNSIWIALNSMKNPPFNFPIYCFHTNSIW